MTMLERRGFLTGLISALAAPAIGRAASLMPVRTVLWTPPLLTATAIPGWEIAANWTYKVWWDEVAGTVQVKKIEQRDMLTFAD
jgi:hypothetical protein